MARIDLDAAIQIFTYKIVSCLKFDSVYEGLSASYLPPNPTVHARLEVIKNLFFDITTYVDLYGHETEKGL